MSKVFLVARDADRQRLLRALGALGVVHLAPVDPAKAVPDEKTSASLDRLSRALQVLSNLDPRLRALRGLDQVRITGLAPVEAPKPVGDEKTSAALDHLGRAIQVFSGVAPSGRPIALDPEQAAQEVLDLQRAQAERHAHLTALHRQHEHQAVWGDVRTDQLRDLAAADLTIRVVIVPTKAAADLRADCVHLIRRLPDRQVLVALADRGRPAPLPEGARQLPLPATDRPTLRASAAKIDAELRASARRLAELAHLVPQMEAARAKLRSRAAFTAADRSGLDAEPLFALQGWVPAAEANGLAKRLASQGVHAAVTATPAGPDDAPPTLLRAPRWARPAGALLKMLGVVPGYREQDVSPPFMIALPVFAALLISDAGYGLVFLLLPVLFYRWLTARLGKDLTHLLMVFGVTALAWGVITGGYFGFSPADMVRAGGPLAAIGQVLGFLKLFTVEISDSSQHTLMRISFLLAAIHLSSAHVWRAVLKFPDIRFLSSVGWAVALWGVYGLAKALVLRDAFFGTAYPYLVFGGLGLAISFASPRKYVIDGIMLGALSSIFPAIGMFGDTISYLRLMAIGLAGSVLATKFNAMTLGIGFLPVSLPLLLLAHMLNIGLVLIALLAHGVRLNILEYSVNLGMEWSGYPYEPFAERSQEN